jgi:hypothetical protein
MPKASEPSTELTARPGPSAMSPAPSQMVYPPRYAFGAIRFSDVWRRHSTSPPRSVDEREHLRSRIDGLFATLARLEAGYSNRGCESVHPAG